MSDQAIQAIPKDILRDIKREAMVPPRTVIPVFFTQYPRVSDARLIEHSDKRITVRREWFSQRFSSPPEWFGIEESQGSVAFRNNRDEYDKIQRVYQEYEDAHQDVSKRWKELVARMLAKEAEEISKKRAEYEAKYFAKRQRKAP